MYSNQSLCKKRTIISFPISHLRCEIWLSRFDGPFMFIFQTMRRFVNQIWMGHPVACVRFAETFSLGSQVSLSLFTGACWGRFNEQVSHRLAIVQFHVCHLFLFRKNQTVSAQLDSLLAKLQPGFRTKKKVFEFLFWETKTLFSGGISWFFFLLFLQAFWSHQQRRCFSVQTFCPRCNSTSGF